MKWPGGRDRARAGSAMVSADVASWPDVRRVARCRFDALSKGNRSPMFRVLRRALYPFTRTAVLAFVWTHRHEILRWGRSLYAEITGPGGVTPARLSTIAQVLWKVTSNQKLSRSHHLKSVRLDGDTLVLDVDPGWRGTPKLVSELSEVNGVRRVVNRGGVELRPVIDV